MNEGMVGWPVAHAPQLAAASYTRTSGSYTTTSTTFVDVDATNLNLSINTDRHRVMIAVVAGGNGGGGNLEIMLDVALDGTRLGGDNGLVLGQAYTAGATFPLGFTYITDSLSPGTHTFKLQWRLNTGTTSTLYGALTGTNATPLRFAVVELSAM